MFDRETILPLTIGGLIAVLAHVLLIPAMAHSLRQDDLPQWPDLQVESLTTQGRLVAGRSTTITFALSNRGQAATPVGQPVRIRFALSVDETLSDDDGVLHTHDLPVAAGKSALESGAYMPGVVATFQLPAEIHGQRFLLAVIDPDQIIDEGPNEKNNTFALPIDILTPEQVAKPDLVMLAAASPAGVKADESFAIEFAVGGATDSEPLIKSWFDGVFLSSDETLSDDDTLLTATPGPASILTAGMGYSRSAQVSIPAAAAANHDRMHLIFVADHLNRIEELDETNNTIARSIRIIRPDASKAEEEQARQPQGPSDLHIPVLSAPDSVMNGETLAIDFIIANRGEGTTSASNWSDRVYLSKDDKLDDQDKLLATHARSEALHPGGYYNTRVTGHIELPDDESGQHFLILKTDADNAVEESDENNNIRVRPIQIEQLVLGKDKPDEQRTTVAWIPYDDFRELIAVASQTEQPALQNKVDPIKGAPTPRDPSPPSPPQPQPVEVVQAKKTPDPQEEMKASKQNDPSESPADPAERIASKSPITEPSSKPITQPEAQALALLPVAPKPQPPAQGPDKIGNPVKQPDAQTPRPTPGTPSTQAEIALPKPIAPQVDPNAAIAKPDMQSDVARDPSKSDVTTSTNNPTQQPRADSPVPVPGDPTKLAPSVAPPSEQGEPTKLIPSETAKPSPDGVPTTSPQQKGTDQPQPKPAPSADDNAKATPKAEDAQSTKPVPPTQPSNPTSAPRDESDVPPTILEEKQYTVEPGGVITRPGIQIVASTPNITTPSWLVSGPTARNPIVRITFNKQGEVTKIDMIRSTGHANLDSPIQSSFFNFKAKGEALKKVRDTFSIEIKLLLKNERE